VDRRSFLALLGSVTLVAAANGIWKLGDNGIYLEEEPEIIKPTDLWTGQETIIYEFFAFNQSKTGVATMWLKRPSGGVVMSTMLGPQCNLRYVAVPGEEIVGTVNVEIPEYVDAGIVGRDSSGRVVMARSNGAVVPLYPE
jgi:hypothetical protein